METDTHPCAALGAGRLNGAHTHGPVREGPAPPSARDVSTGHTRTVRRGTAPLFFFLNNLRSVNTERAEARGHGGGWGEDVVPIAQ